MLAAAASELEKTTWVKTLRFYSSPCLLFWGGLSSSQPLEFFFPPEKTPTRECMTEPYLGRPSPIWADRALLLPNPPQKTGDAEGSVFTQVIFSSCSFDFRQKNGKIGLGQQRLLLPSAKW